MSADLPIDQAGSWFRFTTELNRVTYGFEFLWNERESAWYVTLSDGEGNVLVAGRKVLLGALFKPYRARAGVMQDGDVYVVDTSGRDLDAGYNDLGNRIVLAYATDEEAATGIDTGA